MTDIQKIKQQMCDGYCKMPEAAADQEELDELCKYCPLNNLREPKVYKIENNGELTLNL